jgi:hypothetical protein
LPQVHECFKKIVHRLPSDSTHIALSPSSPARVPRIFPFPIAGFVAYTREQLCDESASVAHSALLDIIVTHLNFKPLALLVSDTNSTFS